MKHILVRAGFVLAATGYLSATAHAESREAARNPDGIVQVSLNSLEISLDSQTGCIVKLAHPATGTILEAPRDSAGLIDVAYPVHEFLPMRLATRFSKAKIDRQDSAVTIAWDPLGPSRTGVRLPEGRVIATMRIQTAPDARSVILQCTIDNKSSALIPQVLFPDLRGLRPLAGTAGTQLRLPNGYPVYPFTEDPIPPYTAQFFVNSGWKEYPPSTGTYGVNALRWLDFGGYQGGLSIFQKTWGTSERPTVRTWRSQADLDSLRIVWEYKSGIKPGQSWQSDEVWLTPHPGGWAKGIEVFREFVKTKHPQRPLPTRIRDGLGFRTAFMIQAPEKDPAYAAFRFTDLPKLAAEAKEHGLIELCLWGWCDYFNLPYRIRPELGTREEFLDGIRQAEKLGVTVCPFVSCVLVRNSFAQRYGGTPGAPAWVYHPDLVPMMDPYYLGANYPLQFWSIFSAAPQNQNWHADVTAAFKEWIDAGVTCWSWDQVFADAPNSKPPGLTDLLASLRKLAQARNPNATFSGEEVGSLEFDGGVLDYTWNWADYTDAAPITSVMRTPRLNANIDDSPRVVKAAFADNLFINAFPRKPDQPNGTAMISEKPEMASALKEVAALRKQFLPYFVDGTFIGDSVLSEANPAFVRGYVLRNKLLVIALNNQPQVMSLTIKSRLDLWLPKAEQYEVKTYSADGHLFQSERINGGAWAGTTRPLQPLELAFLEIEAVQG